jgi:hypothetical protein
MNLNPEHTRQIRQCATSVLTDRVYPARRVPFASHISKEVAQLFFSPDDATVSFDYLKTAVCILSRILIYSLNNCVVFSLLRTHQNVRNLSKSFIRR